MLISSCWLAKKISPRVDGIASPATSSGIPAAMTEANTNTRMIAANGSDTVSARWRSFSDWVAESFVSGA